jgi:1,2-phenylacetyl-CoA epoxidase PaaB subunit
MIYEIFARKSRGESLRHIGNLNAPDDDLARVYAFSTYDEEKWFDMFVAPRDRFIEVFNRLDADSSDVATAAGTAAAKAATPREAEKGQVQP